jgi:hypothetical protein
VPSPGVAENSPPTKELFEVGAVPALNTRRLIVLPT